MLLFYTPLLTIAFIWSVIVLSPGPNFFLTVDASLNHSRLLGVIVAFGIGIGTFIWSVVGLLSLDFFIGDSKLISIAVSLLGAAYLFYLSATLLKTQQAYERVSRKGTLPPKD